MKQTTAQNNSQLPMIKKTTVAEARHICKDSDALISWRPEVKLPEEQQYCLVQEQIHGRS